MPKIRRRVQKEVVYLLVGSNIAKVRKKKDLSQGDLAEKLGVILGDIENIELGGVRVSLILLYKIAQALNISVYELLPETATDKLFQDGIDFIQEAISKRLGSMK